MSDILIIGAGAAGLMAAGAAVQQGHRVTVLEHTEQPGQKLLITGKGRCNVTNACGEEEFLRHIRKNSRFLYSSLNAFPPVKTMELFEQLGVPLKTERGRRVFPVSDRAEDIRQALLRYCGGARILHEEAARLVLEPATPPEPTGPAAGCAALADEALPARREKHAPRAQKQKGPRWICRGAAGRGSRLAAAYTPGRGRRRWRRPCGCAARRNRCTAAHTRPHRTTRPGRGSAGRAGFGSIA